MNGKKKQKKLSKIFFSIYFLLKKEKKKAVGSLNLLQLNSLSPSINRTMTSNWGLCMSNMQQTVVGCQESKSNSSLTHYLGDNS